MNKNQIFELVKGQRDFNNFMCSLKRAKAEIHRALKVKNGFNIDLETLEVCLILIDDALKQFE